jgi:VWFA-related protein
MSTERVFLSLLSLLAVVTVSLAVPAAGSRAQTRRPAQKQPPRPVDPKQKRVDPPEGEIPTSDDPLRLGAELVNVLFTASDASNRIVEDITQQDVVVLEDGRPQQIFTFKREANLPISIALLIDLSGSQEYTFPQEKAAATYFLNSIIRPGKDLAAILTFQDDVDLVQGLTSRVETLNRALDDVQYSRRFGSSSSRNQATALFDSIYITVDEVLGREEQRSSYATDYSVRRRAIVLLTDGADNASSRKLEEAIDRAWRSGVMIYSIGIGDRFRFEGVREDVLVRLSEQTGGRAFFPHSAEELGAQFRQIENELRSQYLVAYNPSNTARDGSFRRIEVRLGGRPDLRVTHRRGYYAPSGERSGERK